MFSISDTYLFVYESYATFTELILNNFSIYTTFYMTAIEGIGTKERTNKLN